MSLTGATTVPAHGTADPVRAVSVVSTGTVEIHPEQPYGTRKPLYWWLLTSRRRYYVYVVELDDAVGPRRNPRYPSVYVGQSVVPPKERLRQHKDGYRSSRYVRKHGKHLRPGLYRRFNPMATRDEAVATEQELARRLRNRGYTVYGGH